MLSKEEHELHFSSDRSNGIVLLPKCKTKPPSITETILTAFFYLKQRFSIWVIGVPDFYVQKHSVQLIRELTEEAWDPDWAVRCWW